MLNPKKGWWYAHMNNKIKKKKGWWLPGVGSWMNLGNKNHCVYDS
jgi:hypothetical protein